MLLLICLSFPVITSNISKKIVALFTPKVLWKSLITMDLALVRSSNKVSVSIENWDFSLLPGHIWVLCFAYISLSIFFPQIEGDHIVKTGLKMKLEMLPKWILDKIICILIKP